MIKEFVENNDGYIVYEDSGHDLYSYGASEKWFGTYLEAINYAMGIVDKNTKVYMKYIDIRNVIVYKGSKNLLGESHSCPCGEVVFCWSNYKRK